MTKLALFLAGLLVCANTFASTCVLEFDNGAVLVDVELAVTPEAMKNGLSNRDGAGRGMLFSWPESDYRAVWMKDTRIPLSVAYIDAHGVVRQIVDLEPMTTTFHWSTLPVTDVLELASGQFEQHGITTNTVLVHRQCRGDL